MEVIIISVFLLLFVGFVLYNIISGIRIMVKWYFGDYINKYLLIAKIDPLYKEPLRKYLKYYQQLNPSDRIIFEKRVQKFINQKQFIARGMDKITDEMKSLIAGSAIQLTFGHPSIYFAHFRRILVYPDNYYSEISKRYHKGEVNMGGLIVLSWKNFVKGYLDNEDGRNLGLHEMAHALRLENAISNEEYGFLDDETLKTWTDLSYREMNKMEVGESDFFRAYAATNSQEFFAVAVENFFERSDEFLKWNPKMYYTLAEMLNQDPLRIGKLK
jgi:Mlc titration factor MtfA (ptsG expression regulator)